MLRVTWFVGAFALGLLYVYITEPARKVVLKFPNPHNAGAVVYRASDDGCFKYRATPVACPNDVSKVRHQPITEEFVPDQKPRRP